MPYKKGGSGLNMVVQSLPPGQFTVVDTRAVLNKLMCIQEGAVQKYGPGNFRWVCTVGDLSAMYDEVDPILACDKAEFAISCLPEWTGRRLCEWLNMSYSGSTVAWGKANREHRVDVDFTRLIQMCRFDCAHTLYKFCGQVNRRKFGVPMGGFMSPGLAILCCAMVEMEMEQGPEGLIGTVVRFMDDVFGVYAVGNDAEEQLVREYYGGIAVGYPPPLVLNVEQPADSHRFLELELNTGRGLLQCLLFNPVYSAVTTGGRILQRLPEHGGGTSKRDRLSWIIGTLFRIVYGCLTPTDVALSVCKLAVELELSRTSSSRGLLRVALLRVSVIILESMEEDERMKEFSGTFVFLYRMLGGL